MPVGIDVCARLMSLGRPRQSVSDQKSAGAGNKILGEMAERLKALPC